MANEDNPGNAAASDIEKDAAGQYRKGITSSDNNGVASAKPRVITGSDDATVNKTGIMEQEPKKDWDLNYDPADMNEGDFRG